MHIAFVSKQTADRRRRNVEDVQKRSEYRKAHGIGQDEGVFGGWTAKTDAETLGPALREGSAAVAVPVAEVDASPVVAGTAADVEETFVDFDGKKQPLRKKWLGIW